MEGCGGLVEGLSPILSMSWRVWRRNSNTFARRFSREDFIQNASTTLHQPQTLHLFERSGQPRFP